jgi:predicted permease
VRGALLVIQGALSVLLLVAAGLFVRSLYGVGNLRLGFDVDPVMVVDVNMHGVPFNRAQSLALWDQLLATARLVPGVERATLSGGTPMAGVPNAEIMRPPEMDDRVFQTLPFIYESNVSPEYFATVGTRILRGRGFDSTDAAGAERVAVVGSGLARTLWPGRDPIGQCIRIRARVPEARGLQDRPCSYVVGVAEDVKNRSIRTDPDLFFYLPYAQEVAWRPRLAIRTRGDAARYVDAVRAALQRDMPGSAYVTVTPYSTIVGDETRSWRMGATMFAAFGALAMVLAALGLYSAISYDVAQRTHEIGVRRALGAQGGDVVRLVLRQGLLLGGVGVLAGAAIALATADRIAPMLFEESPRDPLVYVVVVATMLAVAVAAAVAPARRAARVDPTIALRAE